MAIYDCLVDNYDIDPKSGCWNWNRSKGTNGYGHLWLDEKCLMAHRYYYEAFVKPIPKGMVIHHKCGNRSCVNPDHLEVRTQRENILSGSSQSAINARKTHCIHGHEFTPENTYVDPVGTRHCRICQDAHIKRNIEKRRKYGRNYHRRKSRERRSRKLLIMSFIKSDDERSVVKKVEMNVDYKD